MSTQLVDPETKEPLDIVDGATGERVKTALRWEAQPQLRSSVGDVYQVLTDPLPGPAGAPRIKVLGRIDDLLIVKGVKVYPAALCNVVSSLVPDTTGEMPDRAGRPAARSTRRCACASSAARAWTRGSRSSWSKRLQHAMHDRSRSDRRSSSSPPAACRARPTRRS